MAKSPWTDHAEAISFISATLGQPFVIAQGDALYWAGSGKGDGCAVGLRNLGSEIKVVVNFSEVESRDHVKLFAIIGWAHVHECEVEHD